MQEYKGKSRCGFNCTKRARYVGWRGGFSHNVSYACTEHRHKIEHLPDRPSCSEGLSEADYDIQRRFGI